MKKPLQMPAAPKFDYLNPDYGPIFRHRLEVLRRIRAQPQCVSQLKAYYKENEIDFISDWGVTFDPRNIEIGLPSIIPFVLWPKQREFGEFILDRWRAKEPGLGEKSRDWGASWIAVSLSCGLCLHNEGMVVGFGSRKEEYVDKIGQPKSLFWKARTFMENLPVEFRGGWVAWRDSPHMRINFPETGSVMTGEAGNQIGRGDRTGIYFVDEAQPLDAKIMTPDGYRLMADMRIGSDVIGVNGKPQKVTHINDCGVHDVFRVTFSDGTSAQCSPNHLWTVDKVIGKRERVTLRTHEIADSVFYESPKGQVQYRYRIPACDPVDFGKKNDLPLDPYVVGALLGDGSVNSGVVRLTSADQQIVAMVAALLPSGVAIGAFDGRYSYNIVDALGRRGRTVGGEYVQSRARSVVTAAGIRGLKSSDKFIPAAYKFSSSSDRLALLQGLMDTDGSATGGASAFYTSSPRLAEDVRFIVQSLGGTATHNVKPDARGYKDQHDIHLNLPTGMVPFRLDRKIAQLRMRKHPPGRTIVAVDRVGRRPVRCITVEAANGLYLTDNFIVTHNSAHLEQPVLVEHSLSQTTNCRIDISSVNTMNNPFAQKRWGGKVKVFIMDWRDDPRKNQAWYDKQCAELDPVTVAQEIDRDYSASATGVVIPRRWLDACVDAIKTLGIAEATGAKSMALDVADEGRDLNAVAGGRGVEVDLVEEWSGKGSDTFATAERAFEICDENDYPGFSYDADGIGATIRGDSRVINQRRKENRAAVLAVEAFRGSDAVVDPDGLVFPGDKDRVGARTNKDYFHNRKAQAWWELRGRAQRTFRWVEAVRLAAKTGQPIDRSKACSPDEILSISPKCGNHLKLIGELSQATYGQSGAGKMLINKMPDGMKSPNMADAVVIKFAKKRAVPMKISAEVIKRSAMKIRARR